MSMERLTDNTDYCTTWSECEIPEGKCVFLKNCYDRKIYNKLREYEDAEEQGLLVRLPCNVGDVLWWADAFGDIRNSKVNSMFIEQGIDGVVIETMIANVNSKDIGKTVFLTREEAEAALTEMEERR